MAEIEQRYETLNLNIAQHGYFEISRVQSSYVSMHWHDAIELIYLLKGELTVETEQKTQVLEEGQCVLLNPYTLHSTTSVGGNTALLLQIPVEELNFFTEEVRSRYIWWNLDTANAEEIAAMERVKDRMKQLQCAAEGNNPFSEMRMASLLLEIAYLIYTDFSRPTANIDFAKSEKNRQRLNAAISYTEKHYRENISLLQVAESLHLQLNYFCRFFKENTGMTYLQYLNEYRFERVCNDMMATDIPINQILEERGFTNYKLFRAMFARRFQGTPGDVRKKWRQSENV